MTKTDEVYLSLLRDIMENGVEKDTRAGRVKSVFGRQLEFDLKEGFPLLTTKKVFTKGIIHELLWFLQRPYNSHGSMNIEYLVRNGVHIWDDDAYRWFKQNIVPTFKSRLGRGVIGSEENGKFDAIVPKDILVCVNDDERGEKPAYEYWIERDARTKNSDWLENITKEEFLDLTLQKVEIRGLFFSKYRFGDLGPIYGKQWRSFGESGVDQIQNIIDTLKTNPNDRRMLCVAFNPDQLSNMALPPCHVMFQFYTREISPGEYGLSCMWVQRSVDTCTGLPFNITSYALLTHMIAHLVGMKPDRLVGSLGDCHIYENHIDGVIEQVNRDGINIVPSLRIKREVKSIDDFRYDDFEILDYYPDPPIKYKLNVG